MKPQPKPFTPRDEKYLQFIRKQPCCVCGWQPSESYSYLIHAHHTTTGGTALKGSDYEAVPLCFKDHGVMDGKRKDDIPQLSAIIGRLKAAYELSKKTAERAKVYAHRT